MTTAPILVALLVAHAAVAASFNVMDFGAAGDGATDDTAAFQVALDVAGAAGGGRVQVPTGRFYFESHLSVPAGVTLEGIWRAPVRNYPHDKGSSLFPTEGHGNASATPFIALESGAGLANLSIFYPNQNGATAYPYTVQGKGRRCSIVNVNIINPWRAVDFGTYPCDEHLVKALWAEAIDVGIYIDQSDGGRMEDVHFWPFWEVVKKDAKYANEQGIAFKIGRATNQTAINCFAIFYQKSAHFADFGHGVGYGSYTNWYMDITPNAMTIDGVDATRGISFTNCLLSSGVVINASNTGPVRLVGCSFGSTEDQRFHIKAAGAGPVLVDSCFFSDRGATILDENGWIDADCSGITVTSSLFRSDHYDRVIVKLREQVRQAVITANRLNRGIWLENLATDADLTFTANVGPDEFEGAR